MRGNRALAHLRGTPIRIRTLTIGLEHLYANSITPSEHGSRGGIRTHTEAILSRSPLPNWDTRPLVGEVGLEPTHPYGYDILSVARLPIPPHPRY